MKWLLFVFTLLACTVIYKEASGKTPKVVNVSESDVTTVQTALGYTTMLQFDGRPTSAVLGDQDAFRVEYVGNSLAIKPVLPHSKTNLFVFTDYDRFNFKLVAGASDSAEYLIKVKRKGSLQAVQSEGNISPKDESPISSLVTKSIFKKVTCSSASLVLEKVAWPESKANFLIQFKVIGSGKASDIQIQPGDFELLQGSTSLPIETIHLSGLGLNESHRQLSGTIVMHQRDIKSSLPVRLKFAPDALPEKTRACLQIRVPFAASGKSN